MEKIILDPAMRKNKQNNGDVVNLIKHGLSYFKQGDYPRAIECCDKAIKLSPNDAMAYNALGYLYSKQCDYYKACEYYKKGIEFDPKNVAIYKNLGNLYLQQKDYENAIECYMKAIELDPKNVHAYYNLGNIYYYNLYFEHDRYYKASECYMKVIELDPKNVHAYYNLGIICLLNGKFAKAIESLQKVIELAPKSVKAYNGLGCLYFEQGDNTEAIEHWHKAMELDPKNDWAHKYLIEAYIKEDDIAKADEFLQKMIGLPVIDKAWKYYLVGCAYSKQGDYDKAIICLNRAIKLTPKSFDCYLELGRVFSEKKDQLKADECYQKAIALNPYDPSKYIEMGRHYLDQGNIDKTIECYQKAIELRGEYDDYYYELGCVYLKKGNRPKSRECFQEAIELTKNKAWMYDKIGSACFKLGDIDKAIVCYQEVIGLRPKSARVYNELSGLFLKKGYHQKAEECFQKWIKLDPKCDWKYTIIGRAYYVQGYHANAIEYYQKAIELKPQDWKNYSGIISICIEKRDYNGANDWFVKAIGTCKSRHLLIANYISNMFDRPDAAKSINRCLDGLSEKYSETVYGYGLLEMMQGSLRRSVQTFLSEGSIFSKIAAFSSYAMLVKDVEIKNIIDNSEMKELHLYPIPIPTLSNKGTGLTVIYLFGKKVKPIINIISKCQTKVLSLSDIAMVENLALPNMYGGAAELFLAYCIDKMDKKRNISYRHRTTKASVGLRATTTIATIPLMGVEQLDNVSAAMLMDKEPAGYVIWNIDYFKDKNIFSMKLEKDGIKYNPAWFDGYESERLVGRFKGLIETSWQWPQKQESYKRNSVALYAAIDEKCDKDNRMGLIIAGDVPIVISVDGKCGQYSWELISKDGKQGPLCIQTVITRQAPAQNMNENPITAPLKMLLIAGKFDESTKNAAKECSVLKDYIETNLGLLDSGLLDRFDLWDDEYLKTHSKEELISSMMDYDIVHYTGHGIISSDKSWSGIQVKERDKYDCVISGWDILTYLRSNIGKAPNLFFLNACNTGEGIEGRGVGYDMVQAGIRCCIGTFWKIDDDPDPIIAKEFYRCFLEEGLPYGESFRRARALAYEKGHKSWMQYAAYGNPMIRVLPK